MMENKALDRYQIPYTNLVVRKFAERNKMTLDAAFAYLLKFGGIQYLVDFYDVEHTLPLEDTIDEITQTCHAAGGAIV